MPLYKLVSEMPYEELGGWLAFFDLNPVGWQEDYRAYLIMRSMGSEAKPGDLFESLGRMQKIKKASTGQFAGLLNYIKNAKGGTTLAVDEA